MCCPTRSVHTLHPYHNPMYLPMHGSSTLTHVWATPLCRLPQLLHYILCSCKLPVPTTTQSFPCLNLLPSHIYYAATIKWATVFPKWTFALIIPGLQMGQYNSFIFSFAMSDWNVKDSHINKIYFESIFFDQFLTSTGNCVDKTYLSSTTPPFSMPLIILLNLLFKEYYFYTKNIQNI